MRTSITHRRPTSERAAQALCLLALVLAVVAGAGTASAQAATKASPCWNKLINDWYDGRIDHSYEVHCYRDALKHLPRDVRTYSDAYDVISRALASATRDKKHSSQNSIIPPPGNSGGGPGSGPGDGGPTAGPGGGTGTTKGPNVGGKTTADGGGFLNDGAEALGSDRADSVPVPLLVLAGLALLLVAAGAAGLIARRVQARRTHP